MIGEQKIVKVVKSNDGKCTFSYVSKSTKEGVEWTTIDLSVMHDTFISILFTEMINVYGDKLEIGCHIYMVSYPIQSRSKILSGDFSVNKLS